MFAMVKNVIKNLLSRPSTRLFPFQTREFFPNVRGSIDNDPDTCIYCGACQLRCPAEAITVSRTEKVWTINPYKCILCGVCAQICPKKSISVHSEYVHPQSSKIKKVRQKTVVEEVQPNA